MIKVLDKVLMLCYNIKKMKGGFSFVLVVGRKMATQIQCCPSKKEAKQQTLKEV